MLDRNRSGMTIATVPQRLAIVAGAALFCLLAILNCGGYRYGIGDQAFYVPAVVQHLDPALFPRDRTLRTFRISS